MIALLRRGFEEEITVARMTEALRPHSTDDAEQLAAVLDPFLRTVPDAIAAALAMSKDPRCGRAVAFATGSILTYLFDEQDLLPEASFGTLGLVDDAYLVHAFVALLRQTYPFVELPAAYSAPDAHALEVVASLLPEGVAQSLLRTCESTIQVAQALFAAGGNDNASGLVQPELRVGNALRALH